MEIYKDFSFDSAHFLPNVPDGHKCKNMHGHTYKLRVFVKGTPDPFYGWIMELRAELGIPERLGAMGVGTDCLAQMSDMAIVDPTAGGNPVKLTRDAAEALYAECI